MNSGASLPGWSPHAAQPQKTYGNPSSPSLLKRSAREAARTIPANNQHPTDSLANFGSKLALVDSASSTHGRHFAGSAVDDSSEQMEPMDLAALGRLLPDLDDGDQPSSAGQAPAAPAAMAGANKAGRPLRQRVGSTASVEEDIFSSVGGLELGHDPNDPAGSAAAAEQLLSGSGSLGIPSVASLADLAPVDTPSRTLFVQNVAAGVPDDEIRRLFAAHGDLRTLYTACKQQGLVIVGYFDLRSAISAARQLSGYNLGGTALEVSFSAPKKGETNQVNQGVVVVYNLDPDTTNDQLVWIFSRFGEVKDIQQSPTRTNQKFIEFFDVRHAAAALRAMNKAELSRLPAAVPTSHLGGASSSSLAAMLGADHDAAVGGRPRGLSGDGSAARHGDAADASSTQHALAAAQVAAAMQQLELEQQQQQQSFQRSQGQPIPQPPRYEQQMALAMQQDNLQQQVTQRGMVRPVSGMLDRLHTAVSPPLSLGPLSQSWDTSGNPGSLSGLLNRQQQQQSSQQQQHAQQPGQQQQSQQALLQQQQQQFLLQQLASGLFNRGSRTDLSGLDPVLETDNGNEDLQKLLLGTGVAAAAGGIGSTPGPGTANPARPSPMGNSSMHVSDSASSIASTQGNVFGAGAGLMTGGHALHHGPFGPRAPGMPGPSGTPAFGSQQPLGPNAAAAVAAAAAAAAAAGNANALQRSLGSSDQLHGMEQLISQQAAAAGQDDPGSAGALGMLGNSMSANSLAAAAAAAGLSANAAANVGLGGAGGLGNGIASASFDSGLNLIGEGQQHAGLSGLLGSHPYLLNVAGEAAAAGGLYRGAGAAAGPGGMRSLSHPCLSMSAMAAMAAQQAQQQQQHQQQQNAAAAAAAAVAAGRLLNQQNAAAAAAMLQAQAAGLNLQDLQQQQQQQMALQQLLQANLHAQTLAGAANLHAAQQLLQAGMHPQQLAAAGLLNPASLASLGLPGSSSYGSLHNLGALQLQSAAAAAAASAAAAAAEGSSGISRGASTGSLSGLTDGRGHRGVEGGASSSGGSRGGGRLSRRAADPAVEAERKAQQEKLFALDVDRILSGEDKRTTLMIKNIPNKYTQKMLLQTIEEQFKGTFDFFYLPIDFKNKCNVGYAFINMLSPQYIPPLVARFNNKRWDKFNSEKVCNISYGRIQGRAALISHFQNSSLMHEDKRCRPVLFISEGPDAGEPEPFPMGVHARPRVAGSSGGGGSSGHLSSERSPRVSSSGAMSGGSAAGGSLAGSRANSSTALANAAAAASQPGSEQGLGSSSSHGGSGGGLAGGAAEEHAGGAGGTARGSSFPQAPPGL